MIQCLVILGTIVLTLLAAALVNLKYDNGRRINFINFLFMVPLYFETWLLLYYVRDLFSDNFSLNILWLYGIVLITLYFLTTEFIQYCRNKGTPTAAQRLIRAGTIWMLCVLFLAGFGLLFALMGQ